MALPAFPRDVGSLTQTATWPASANRHEPAIGHVVARVAACGGAARDLGQTGQVSSGRDLSHVGERPPSRRRPACGRCFPSQLHPEEPSFSPNHRGEAIRHSPAKLTTPRIAGVLIHGMTQSDIVGGGRSDVRFSP
jgi:hypothetical protein